MRLLQMVENLEECILCTLEVCKILDIIHNQHINRLIEHQEIWYAIVIYSILELQFERISSHIQHSRIRVERTYFITNSISQVRFTNSAATKKE